MGHPVHCTVFSVHLDSGELRVCIVTYRACAVQERAFDASQKYKEGKFIIEVAHMLKENNWCDGGGGDGIDWADADADADTDAEHQSTTYIMYI